MQFSDKVQDQVVPGLGKGPASGSFAPALQEYPTFEIEKDMLRMQEWLTRRSPRRASSAITK